jgi:hypothetical protein
VGSGAGGVRCGARSRLEIRCARAQSAEPDGREGGSKQAKQAKAETWSGGAVAMAKWWPGGRWWGGVWPQIDFLSNIFAGLLSSVLFFVFLYLLVGTKTKQKYSDRFRFLYYEPFFNMKNCQFQLVLQPFSTIFCTL